MLFGNRHTKYWLRLGQMLALLLMLAPVLGQASPLIIDIVGGGDKQIGLAVTSFVGERGQDDEATMAGIIRADLQRTGLFRLINTDQVPQGIRDPANVVYRDWQARQAEHLVIGTVEPSAGKLVVRFRLLDVAKAQQTLGLAYTIAPAQTRQTAHRIADLIYEKLTGEPGVFSTQIAYVQKQNGRFELLVADADGYRPQVILSSAEPIISPKWSPEGNRLAYVSFEQRKPVVYVHQLDTGERKVVAAFKGSNSSPAWSPDGRKLAVVLTQQGESQIYTLNVDGTGLNRVTQSLGIDTEPVFSADGQSLFFTSDRGGSPQIYRMPVNGGHVQRVTYSGNYNVSPRLSPDGKTLAFVQREQGAIAWWPRI